MSSLIERIKKEFTEPLPKAGAVFLMIAGIFLGTVFTVGMRYWESPVTKAEAISVSAAFSSCREVDQRGRTQEILVRFSDHEQLTIDGACLSDEVIGKVAALKPGTVLKMYVHPNSDCILEMVDNGEVILAFDETVSKLSAEVSGFTVLGILMYLGALLGIVKLIRKEIC